MMHHGLGLESLVPLTKVLGEVDFVIYISIHDTCHLIAKVIFALQQYSMTEHLEYSSNFRGHNWKYIVRPVR